MSKSVHLLKATTNHPPQNVFCGHGWPMPRTMLTGKHTGSVRITLSTVHSGISSCKQFQKGSLNVTLYLETEKKNQEPNKTSHEKVK